MKAISLWQPWASLWLTPRKNYETRHWATRHRGWLAVHAAQRFEKDHPPELAEILRAQFGADWYRTLPAGAIIGVVNVVGCFTTEEIVAYTHDDSDDLKCGDFSPGRFGWQRGDDFKLLQNPIPYRGRQSIFSVPDALVMAHI